jgi:hypothetical protein
MKAQRQDSRRSFLSRMFLGSAAIALAGASAGCLSPDVALGGDGAIEVLPRRSDLWCFNLRPTSIPGVRSSTPVAPDWSTSKAGE